MLTAVLQQASDPRPTIVVMGIPTDIITLNADATIETLVEYAARKITLHASRAF
jgi:hypothetical protein